MGTTVRRAALPEVNEIRADTTPRILIVDDDSRFRRTLHLALDSHGYEVIDAADGEEALRFVAAGAPDLIVLDWQMPGMDGIRRACC